VRTDDDAVVRHASVGIELRHVGAFDGAFGKAVVDGIERFKAFLRCPRLLINRFRHKLKIPESSQNDPNEENNKDTCFVLALLNVPYFASIMFFR
jgi:hypothetical protein